MDSIKYITIFILISTNTVFSQTVDMMLDVDLESNTSVYPGFVGQFSVTVTNNGPDMADSPTVFTPRMFYGVDDYFFLRDTSISQPDCFFYIIVGEPRPPSFPGADTLSIDTIPIPPGGSVTCYGIYAVGFESGNRETFWQVVNSGSGGLTDDPFPENNLITVLLGIPPQPVDSMSKWSLALLMIFILILFYWHARSGLLKGI